MTTPDSSFTFGGWNFDAYWTLGAFNWTPPADVEHYSVLLVAGGGGGATQGNGAGAGGAGGLRIFTARSCTPGVDVSGSVGAGGAGATGATNPGTDGGSTSLGSDSVTGGGGGGAGSSGTPANNGRPGGCGGGGSGATLGNASTGGTGVAGEGFAGAAGNASSTSGQRAGGGGGGSRAVGVTAGGAQGGNGGPGYDASWWMGTTLGVSGVLAGGGGGGSNATTGGSEGTGGAGGGGNGGRSSGSFPGQNATANTGSGGGGGGGSLSSQTNGGNGAGGLVVIRYKAVTTPTTPDSTYVIGADSYEVFDTVGPVNWEVPADVTTAEALAVGGGGAGGTSSDGAGGGGGGGAVRHLTGLSVTPGDVIPCAVGGGGVASTGQGYPGGDTYLGTDIAQGGGGGGSAGTSGRNGMPGGSGGGGGGVAAGSAGTGGTPGTGGNDGGAGNQTAVAGSRRGGGGGGGGADGVDGTTSGNGGAGVDMSADFGTSVGVSGLFGGGGGGACSLSTNTPGTGGTGGGGRGADGPSAGTAPLPGSDGTGGGGGGGVAAGDPNAGQAGGAGILIIRYPTPTPPDAPEDLALIAATGTTLEFGWHPPSAGASPTGFEVRIDGGTPVDVGNVLSHEFTGLTPGTSYDLEVRAYNGAGASSWAGPLTVETTPAGPSSGYVADVRIGAHTWECVYDDTPGIGDPDVPNLLAGATFTWTAPDDVGWPPAVPVMPLDLCTLRVAAPAAEDVADVDMWDVVRFKFTPVGYDFTAPLVDFAGRVTSTPRITDNPAGGVFLEVTASDLRVDLKRFTVFGREEEFVSGNPPDDPELGQWTLIETNMSPIGAIRGMADWLGDPWNGAEEVVFTPQWNIYMGMDFGDIFAGLSIDDDDWPMFAGATVQYAYGDLLTLWDIFSTLTLMPMPNYDDNGDYVLNAPFVFVPVELDGSDYTTAAPIDACLVPNPAVDWRRGYTPDTIEVTSGAIGWNGSMWELPAPDPARVVRVNATDLQSLRFNFPGFTAEIPEADTVWGLYSFTVLAHLEPLAVTQWFTYPARVRRYVTVDNIAADKDPNATGQVAGMLGGATLTVEAGGKWSATGHLRLGHPGPPPEE